MDGSVGSAPLSIADAGGFRLAHQSGAHNAARGPVTNEVIDALLEYSRAFVTKWNAIANTNGRDELRLAMPERRDVTPYARNPIALKVGKAIATMGFEDAAKKYGGAMMLYEDKMDTIQRTLIAMRGDRHVAVNALMQWGKTLVMTFATFFHQMYIHDEGLREDVVIVCPSGSNNPKSQTHSTVNQYLGLHAALRFENSDYKLGMVNGDARDTRVTKRNDAMIRQIVKQAAETDLNGEKGSVIIIVDEADVESWVNSALAKLLTYAEKLGVRLKFCGVSATGFAYIHSDNFVTITVEVGPEYAGIIAGTRYPILSHSMAAKLGGLVNKDGTPLLTGFRLQNDYATRAGEVAQFIEHMLVHGIDAPEHGLLGMPCNGGRGAVLRYGAYFQLVGDGKKKGLLPLLEKALPKHGITVVRLFGAQLRKISKEGKTLLEWANEQFPEGRYLLVVCGAARRADQFASDCSCFFDFTDKFSVMESMMQGSCGRASGYDKIVAGVRSVVVFLSETNAEFIADWRRTGCPPLPYRYAVVADRVRRSTHRSAELLFSDPKVAADTALLDVARRVERAIVPLIHLKKVNATTGRKDTILEFRKQNGHRDFPNHVATLRREGKNGPLWNHYGDIFAMIGEKGAKAIERHLTARFGDVAKLLRPGQTTDAGRYYATAQDEGYENYVRLTAGDFHRSGNKGADTTNRSARAPSQRMSEKDDRNERHVVMLFTVDDKGKFKLMTLTMPLASAVRQATQGTRTLAHPKTIYFGLQTADERDEVEQIAKRGGIHGTV